MYKFLFLLVSILACSWLICKCRLDLGLLYQEEKIVAGREGRKKKRFKPKTYMTIIRREDITAQHRQTDTKKL